MQNLPFIEKVITFSDLILSNKPLWENQPAYILYLMEKYKALPVQICGTGCLIYNKSEHLHVRIIGDLNNSATEQLICSLVAQEIQITLISPSIHPCYDNAFPITNSEYVYSTSNLSQAIAPKLKNPRNRLLSTERFKLIELNDENFETAFNVLNSWKELSLGKYDEEEMQRYIDKDLYFLELCSKHNNHFYKAYLGVLDGNPVSISASSGTSNHHSILALKGLNGQIVEDQKVGERGVTAATYMLLAKELHSCGISFLNDGDSPKGSGAERRKQSWMPSKTVSLYGINI